VRLVDNLSVPGAALAQGGGAAQASRSPGLVRLETSHTGLSWYEQRRMVDHQRRSLRMFKSLSCVGDLLAPAVGQDGRRLRRAFLTLTYRQDVMWSPRHIPSLFTNLRNYLGRRGVPLRYLWVAEQHKSGRVHYHAMIWLPVGMTLPKPDKQGWWPHGMTNVQWARRGIGYLVKYATKCSTARVPFPKGCRLHGHGGLSPSERHRRAWWVLPRYQRERCCSEDRVRRARGGGWFSPISGEWWPAFTGLINPFWDARVVE